MLRLGLPAAVALAFTPFALGAQDLPQDQNVPSAASLNLPTNVTVLGKAQPIIRKATAIINGEIITGTDVDERVALIVIANSAKLSAQDLERLRMQVTRNLIDESLQIQEAKSNKIDVTDDEVEQRFAGVAKNFKRTPAQMNAYLTSIGSSGRSLRRQIKAQIAWDRLLRRKVEFGVSVSKGEVDDIIQRMEAEKGQHEYRVSEIFNAATPATNDEVLANQRKILQQIKGGGGFAAYATQFSESSTASQGGDLGWIRLGILPAALDAQLGQMHPGEIAGPIAIPGGYDILFLADERSILTVDPRDATLALRQISVPFPANITPEQAKAKTAEFGAATQAMHGCGGAKEVAAKFGGDLVDSDTTKLRDLPAQLQDILLKMQVGQATPPFGTMKEGIRVLVMCGRDEPQAVSAPDPHAIESAEMDKRVNIRAQRYLRDLRRDAIIEYR